ncbi:MAG: hypothetical protein AAFQ73_14980 [Pseudomonadota bacterium]
MTLNTPKYGYRTTKVTVPANGDLVIEGVGFGFYCFEADGALQIGLDDGPMGDLFAAVGFEGVEPFARVRLRDVSGADNTVTIGITIGRVTDNRVNFGSSLQVTTDTPATTIENEARVTIPSGGANGTLVLAANTSRREAVLTNAGANPVVIRGDNTAADAGMYLAAGSSAVIEVTGAVYAFEFGAAGGSTIYAAEIQS